jgi:hypothetical protein
MRDFTPYEQALALKELGFDEPCFAYYNIDPQLKTPAFNIVKPFEHEWCLSAPLYQQAFRWFREKHNIDCYVESKLLTTGDNIYDYTILVDEGDEWEDDSRYKTYEEAELVCLNKLIEIVKNEK